VEIFVKILRKLEICDAALSRLKHGFKIP